MLTHQTRPSIGIQRCVISDLGGALRISGVSTMSGCSFTSNMASNSGLAVSAVGSLEISGSSFDGNVFSCEEGTFLEVQKVRKPVVFVHVLIAVVSN